MKWIAKYKNNTMLPQYNEDGSENKYSDIDRDKLSEFGLINDLGEPVIALHLDPGQNLIYRRRVQKRTGEGEFAIYLVGWQMKIDEREIQSIAYVSEDHQVHMAGAWRSDHPWFYPIQLMPYEQQEIVSK